MVQDGEGEVFLGVYRHGKESALTNDVLSEALVEFSDHYEANPNLAIFYTGACYAGYCEMKIREKLRLSKATKMLFAQRYDKPAEYATFQDNIKAFQKDVSFWAQQVPALTNNSEVCTATLLHPR